jgi:hypothetical protein
MKTTIHYFIISLSFLPRIRNVSDKSCRENQNTYFVFNNSFFFSFRKSSRLGENVERYCRAGRATDDDITLRMRITCRITKNTDTHSECVILVAFPLKQWLQDRAILLGYTYTVCLVEYNLG